MKKISIILTAAIIFCMLTGCGSTAVNSSYISKDAALDAACEHYGITETHRATDSFANDKVKLVDGASTPYYLVTFDFGLYMFEYKIAAETGEVLNWAYEANPEYT